MLVLTLIIMGVATFGIGLLPTYAQVGPWAAVGLVLLRRCAGLRRRRRVGWCRPDGGRARARRIEGLLRQLAADRRAGLVCCSRPASSRLFARLPADQFLSWGWRVPFLLSIVLVGVGLVIRLANRGVAGVPSCQGVADRGAAPDRRGASHSSERSAARHRRASRRERAFYIYTVFVLVYCTQKVGMNRETVLNGILIAAACALVAEPFFGCALRSDRPTARVSVWRLRHGSVRVSALLAARHRIDAARLARADRGACPRSRPDVGAAGGVLVGTVRHARPLQRRVARRAALVGGRRRVVAVHCDRLASVWARSACRVHHCDGTHHDRCCVRSFRNAPSSDRLTGGGRAYVESRIDDRGRLAHRVPCQPRRHARVLRLRHLRHLRPRHCRRALPERFAARLADGLVRGLRGRLPRAADWRHRPQPLW